MTLRQALLLELADDPPNSTLNLLLLHIWQVIVQDLEAYFENHQNAL